MVCNERLAIFTELFLTSSVTSGKCTISGATTSWSKSFCEKPKIQNPCPKWNQKEQKCCKTSKITQPSGVKNSRMALVVASAIAETPGGAGAAVGRLRRRPRGPLHAAPGDQLQPHVVRALQSGALTAVLAGALAELWAADVILLTWEWYTVHCWCTFLWWLCRYPDGRQTDWTFWSMTWNASIASIGKSISYIPNRTIELCVNSCTAEWESDYLWIKIV